jgi:hypothetical protein
MVTAVFAACAGLSGTITDCGHPVFGLHGVLCSCPPIVTRPSDRLQQHESSLEVQCLHIRLADFSHGQGTCMHHMAGLDAPSVQKQMLPGQQTAPGRSNLLLQKQSMPCWSNGIITETHKMATSQTTKRRKASSSFGGVAVNVQWAKSSWQAPPNHRNSQRKASGCHPITNKHVLDLQKHAIFTYATAR